MNWDSTKTTDFWEACKRRAIDAAFTSLKDGLEVDFSLPDEKQATSVIDQANSAILYGCDFMQSMKLPPRAMADLMDAVPGILSREVFGSTIQECFAYCAYLELQDQIERTVLTYAKLLARQCKLDADESSSEPKAG